MRWPFRLPSVLKDPVIADRTVDLMAAGFWWSFAAWGIASTLAGLPTISDASTPLYELIWGSSIAILSLVAFGAVVSTFVPSRSLGIRARKKTIELVAVSVLAGFISVYPVLLFLAAIQGDLGRVATFFVAASFLIFPTWRVRHLYFRIRKLREVDSRIGAGQ